MKLTAGFGLLILIVGICGALVLGAVGQIQTTTEDVRDRSVRFATHLSAAAVEAKATANDERGFLLTGDAEFRDGITERNATVVKELQAAAAAAPSREIRDDVGQIRERYVAWTEAIDAEFDLAADNRAAAIDLALEKNRALRKGYEAIIEEATSDANREVAASFTALEDDAARSRTTVIVMIALLVLASIAVGFGLLRGVRGALRPVLGRARQLQDEAIAGLEQGLTAMADGDLTVDVDPHVDPLDRLAKDEIGEVGRTVNSIRESTLASVAAYRNSRAALSDMVGRVAESASSLSTSSQQMATSSEETGRAVGEIARAVGEVAAGAQRQVQSVESTRTVTTEVGEATEASATSAREAAQVAERARERAAEGAGAVASATEAMDLVRSTSAEASAAIRELGAKSEQIGGIVDTITAISEQTNLLALNAAIEAARAGEQGRGFAVVADEVRQLAEESQTAASSIAQLIGEIQDQTARAVDVVEDGAARSDESAKTVEQAREAFTQIDAEVDEVSRRMSEVASAVQRMAEGARQVQDSMAEITSVAEESSASTEQVSASTEQTSASAQQVAAGAQQLATTATELETLARRFRVTAG
ncbi:methyl-accepting chemotaxis protein [Svornostia abyssi]|uniref:Methyl-accepting chemotaxis protein n=1 Tax=Svornostia abyssi TaxID=2898438 RepID=A0ABY5PMX7_9ACTN|nr:methyl-accepting chemotaxis protein [Parviterribacteraceae bacterium J379]